MTIALSLPGADTLKSGGKDWFLTSEQWGFVKAEVEGLVLILSDGDQKWTDTQKQLLAAMLEFGINGFPTPMRVAGELANATFNHKPSAEYEEGKYWYEAPANGIGVGPGFAALVPVEVRRV